jgi:hypothetical protein
MSTLLYPVVILLTQQGGLEVSCRELNIVLPCRAVPCCVVLQRVAEMAAKGLDYKKEMSKLKKAKAVAKAKVAAAGAKK